MQDFMDIMNLTLGVRDDSKKLTDVISWGNGEHYLIDTADIIGAYETMVFACDEEGNVDDWSDLDCEQYSTWDEAQKGHTDMLNKWIQKGESNMSGRTVITIDHDDPRYQPLVDEVMGATDDDLIIVARSEKNKKIDTIKPVGIRNGIYFYVAYQLDDKLAFMASVSDDKIAKAKANTLKKAFVGDMMDVILDNATPLADWVNESSSPMIVITNGSSKSGNGAGILFCEDFFRIMKEKVGGFTILPSSIHEIIIVPDEFDLNIDDLTNMVREVNANEVSDDEYLADRAFRMVEFLD